MVEVIFSGLLLSCAAERVLVAFWDYVRSVELIERVFSHSLIHTLLKAAAALQDRVELLLVGESILVLVDFNVLARIFTSALDLAIASIDVSSGLIVSQLIIHRENSGWVGSCEGPLTGAWLCAVVWIARILGNVPCWLHLFKI